MKFKIPFIYGIAMVLVLYSCHTEIRSFSELLAHLNDPQNGYVRQKVIGDKKIMVKYLPAEFFQLRSGKQKSNASETSGLNRCFLLSIGYADDAGDIMYDNISNRMEYNDRAYDLNFNMEEYISLRCGNNEYKPVLFTMENTYGLQSYRNFLVVFSPENTSGFEDSDLEIVFNDPQFETGISHFIFSAEDVQQRILLKTDIVKS